MKRIPQLIPYLIPQLQKKEDKVEEEEKYGVGVEEEEENDNGIEEEEDSNGGEEEEDSDGGKEEDRSLLYHIALLREEAEHRESGSSKRDRVAENLHKKWETSIIYFQQFSGVVFIGKVYYYYNQYWAESLWVGMATLLDYFVFPSFQPWTDNYGTEWRMYGE